MIIAFKLGDVTMHGDNCVNNFRASYKMFGYKRVIVFCQCFNGEFAKYFANSKQTFLNFFIIPCVVCYFNIWNILSIRSFHKHRLNNS